MKIYSWIRDSRWGTWVELIVEKRYSRPTCYLFAASVSVAGVVVSFVINEATGMLGVPISTLATVIAAIFGGFGPGLLAAVISSVSIDLYLVSPVGYYNFGIYELMRILVFMVISASVSLLVGALRESFERANAAKAEAEKANAQKDAVIEFLSHDLRGPLSSMSLTFQLIRRYAECGSRTADIKRLTDNGMFFSQKMAQLIQTLLNASKIKAGGIVMSPQRNNLANIVSDVYSQHKLLAEEKRIQLKLELDLKQEIPVKCDSMLITQVLANLLQNAFKFTPPGGTISLRAKTEGAHALIQVSDTGSGIPTAQIPYLFEKFWQGKRLTGEGAGLGLFFSRAIVDAHRGQIHVESETGVGTTFSVFLPLAGEGQTGEGQAAEVSLAEATPMHAA